MTVILEDTITQSETSKEIIGAKAYNLLSLKELELELGFKVPKFGVLPTNSVWDKLDNIVANNSFVKGKKIVRSSSPYEDGALSFAGRYESVRDVFDANLGEAILEVVKSADADKVKNYSKDHDLQIDNSIAVIIQEQIDFDYAGTIYSTKPADPNHILMEFNKGLIDPTAKQYALEFYKELGYMGLLEESFLSESFEDDFNLEESWNVKELLEKVAEIALKLEDKFEQPQDIEFGIKDDEIYLVQSRPLTDIQEAVQIEFPSVSKELLLMEGKIVRGAGHLTLPAVVYEGHDAFLTSPNFKMVAAIDPDSANKGYAIWFKGLQNLDKKYSDGYILVTECFEESYSQEEELAKEILGDLLAREGYIFGSMDEMTPNKKGLITFNHSSYASHAMTVAREKGILYIGGDSEDKAFEDLETGEIIEMISDGKFGIVAREKAKNFMDREIPEEYKIDINKVEAISFEEAKKYEDNYQDLIGKAIKFNDSIHYISEIRINEYDGFLELLSGRFKDGEFQIANHSGTLSISLTDVLENFYLNTAFWSKVTHEELYNRNIEDEVEITSKELSLNNLIENPLGYGTNLLNVPVKFNDLTYLVTRMELVGNNFEYAVNVLLDETIIYDEDSSSNCFDSHRVFEKLIDANDYVRMKGKDTVLKNGVSEEDIDKYFW